MHNTLARAALAAAVSALLAAPAAAKTLVYCSEGSPENFTPALNTTGTSFDAARPIYALYGKSEDLVGHYPEAGHSFPDDARRRAYEFLERSLKH